MGKPTGFIEIRRSKPHARPIAVRVRDWQEVYLAESEADMRQQGARCMDCGIPFCHQGCPLGNLIPEWNDLVYRNRWQTASERLHATNNFPEFTGRLCPAPCEGSCVLGINDDPVSIKNIEVSIVDRAFQEGWIRARPPASRTGRTVAVVGSGPAGLAAADQLNRAGHLVTVFERSDRIGGLLRYGIPEFKLEKRWLDRRLALMAEEGVVFRAGLNIGVEVPVAALKRDFDAIVLCGGATAPRDLPIPGRTLAGIHFAVDYLTQQNRICEGDAVSAADLITAEGKHVVIIGGGDTGADCLGTAHRQGAASVAQFELLPRPPDARTADNPWPLWPTIFRTSAAHEEGGERVYSVSTERFVDDGQGHVTALRAAHVEMVREGERMRFVPQPDSQFELKADLVLLAMGFLGPEQGSLLSTLGVKLTERGNVWRDASWMTSERGVFVAGDMQRGQSLIVWAIADGRSAARGVDAYLMGASSLPAAVA
ncbi:MAG TPA: glutamate synthase subunit beta [Vicinamibacterales bacterium]|nr:glutamate synthase subunit beta [Vicinamibacterales bacterium]